MLGGYKKIYKSDMGRGSSKVTAGPVHHSGALYCTYSTYSTARSEHMLDLVFLRIVVFKTWKRNIICFK